MIDYKESQFSLDLQILSSKTVVIDYKESQFLVDLQIFSSKSLVIDC